MENSTIETRETDSLPSKFQIDFEKFSNYFQRETWENTIHLDRLTFFWLWVALMNHIVSHLGYK